MARKLLLLIVWLGVVVGGMVLAARRFDEAPLFYALALALGIAILVAAVEPLAREFGLSSRKSRRGPPSRANPSAARAGDYAVLVMLSAVVVLLGLGVWKNAGRGNLAGAAILFVFLVVFVNIARDYLHRMRQSRRDR